MAGGKNGKIGQIKRKPHKIGPNLRMKKTAKILFENNGKSVSAAMRQAGYPETTAKNPQQLTKSRSWKELMDEYLPEDLIASKHKELLDAEEVVFIPRGKTIIERRRPDFTARKAGVEMGYKLRGNFAPEQIEVTKRKFQDMSNAELAAYVEAAKKKLIKK